MAELFKQKEFASSRQSLDDEESQRGSSPHTRGRYRHVVLKFAFLLGVVLLMVAIAAAAIYYGGKGKGPPTVQPTWSYTTTEPPNETLFVFHNKAGETVVIAPAYREPDSFDVSPVRPQDIVPVPQAAPSDTVEETRKTLEHSQSRELEARGAPHYTTEESQEASEHSESSLGPRGAAGKQHEENLADRALIFYSNRPVIPEVHFAQRNKSRARKHLGARAPNQMPDLVVPVRVRPDDASDDKHPAIVNFTATFGPANSKTNDTLSDIPKTRWTKDSNWSFPPGPRLGWRDLSGSPRAAPEARDVQDSVNWTGPASKAAIVPAVSDGTWQPHNSAEPVRHPRLHQEDSSAPTNETNLTQRSSDEGTPELGTADSPYECGTETPPQGLIELHKKLLAESQGKKPGPKTSDTALAQRAVVEDSDSDWQLAGWCSNETPPKRF